MRKPRITKRIHTGLRDSHHLAKADVDADASEYPEDHEVHDALEYLSAIICRSEHARCRTKMAGTKVRCSRLDGHSGMHIFDTTST